MLAEIDEAPYQAALIQAQGALARDQALLLEARMRPRPLSDPGLAELDRPPAGRGRGRLVKQDEGTVKLDEGAVAAAQVNVNYCRIVSPVDGRVGVRLVDPGNVVSTSDTTGIIIVNQIAPIAVTFTVPQGDFQTPGRPADGFSRPLAVEALSQETGALAGPGELKIADNQVDPTTGTVAAEGALRQRAASGCGPASSSTSKLTLQTLANGAHRPDGRGQPGTQGPLRLCGRRLTARSSARPIVVAVTEGDDGRDQERPAPGETVVTDGQMILKPGTPGRPPRRQRAGQEARRREHLRAVHPPAGRAPR